MNGDEEVGEHTGVRLASSREDETTDLLPMVNIVDRQYGSTSSSSGNNDDDDDFDDENEDEDRGESIFQSNKRGGTIASSNLLVSSRLLAASSFLNKTPSGGEYDTVPTLVEDNVVLVCDTNLDWYSPGGFYYAEDAFYNSKVEPHYAITVSPSIYQKIIEEVYLSSNVPCGMYFCCQGGDGAHTGEAHKDFVDIQLAWAIMGIVFLGMIFISIFDVNIVSFS